MIELPKRRDDAEGLDPVPRGRYGVTIEEAEPDVSSNDNRQLNLVLRVVRPKEFSGRKLRDWIVVKDSTRWKVDQLLRAAGIECSGDKFDEEQLLDREVDVRVSIEKDWNDPKIKRNRVNKYFSVATKGQSSNKITA